jgi:hypothetical protein
MPTLSRFARGGGPATAFPSFVRNHVPELALFALGVVLRLLMLRGYDIRFSYDSDDHWPYIAWFGKHWNLPPLSLSRETYHPPLYYVLAGGLLRLGAGRSVQALSVACGCLRLGLIWFGLERYLPGRRMARLVALALAAVLPASVHLDGMISGEALSGLLATMALLLGAQTLRSSGAARWKYAGMTGIVVGLQLLTKVSALATIGALGLAALLEISHRQIAGEGRLQRFAPWLAGLAMAGAVSGWYFARNERLYHKAFLSGFDGGDSWYLGDSQKTPYLDRRTLGFFVEWRTDVFKFPYGPVAAVPARFWPLIVTSTFVDFYNYHFAPPPEVPSSPRPVSRAAFRLSIASAVGGAAIALVTTAAWVVAFVTTLRRKEVVRPLFLFMPLVAVLGQLHFGIQYPVDLVGPIKGLYMQFASAPLYALFGLAVAWLWNRPRWRPLAMLELAALGGVAAYTIYCRVVGSSLHTHAFKMEHRTTLHQEAQVARTFGREGQIPNVEFVRLAPELFPRNAIVARLNDERYGPVLTTIRAVVDLDRRKGLRATKI